MSRPVRFNNLDKSTFFNKLETSETLNKLDELGFIAEIAASEHYFFEDITLINAYKI